MKTSKERSPDCVLGVVSNYLEKLKFLEKQLDKKIVKSRGTHKQIQQKRQLIKNLQKRLMFIQDCLQVNIGKSYSAGVVPPNVLLADQEMKSLEKLIRKQTKAYEKLLKITERIWCWLFKSFSKKFLNFKFSWLRKRILSFEGVVVSLEQDSSELQKLIHNVHAKCLKSENQNINFFRKAENVFCFFETSANEIAKLNIQKQNLQQELTWLETKYSYRLSNISEYYPHVKNYEYE